MILPDRDCPLCKRLVDFRLAARQPELLERGVEQIAGIVAGEGPAGAVGALQAGREADDQ